MSKIRLLQNAVVASVSLSSLAAMSALPVGDAAWLQDAVKSAEAGSTVTVPRGEYLLTETLMPAKEGVAIVGATGNPADVVIDGQNSVRCVYAKKGTTVGGLTLRHGCYTGSGDGGGGVFAIGALVTNCVIDSCSTVSSYGGAGAYAKDGSAVVDCTFTNNVLNANNQHRHGGGGLFVYDAATRVEGCRFFYNAVTNSPSYMTGGGGVFFRSTLAAPPGGAVRNCTFVGNRARNGAGILGCPSIVEGCLFGTNVSEQTGACIFLLNESNVTPAPTLVRWCGFYGNQAEGGIICVRKYEQYHLAESTFVSNVIIGKIGGSTAGSGALFDHDERNSPNIQSLLSVSNCYIGAIAFTNTSANARLVSYYDRINAIYGTTLEGCLTTCNNSEAFALADNARVENCRFIGNRKGSYWSGSSFVNGVNFSVLRNYGTNVVIRSCLFATNYVGQGKGVAVGLGADGAWACIDNCTFANNRQEGSSGTYGGCVHLTEKSLVRNCLFYKNYDKDGMTVFCEAIDAAVREQVRTNFYNCCDANDRHRLIDGLHGSFFRDPTASAVGLANADPDGTFDYSPARNSPLVDSGMDLEWIGRGSLDITMEKRHKRWCGAHPDVGAWECYVPQGLILVFR